MTQNDCRNLTVTSDDVTRVRSDAHSRRYRVACPWNRLNLKEAGPTSAGGRAAWLGVLAEYRTAVLGKRSPLATDKRFYC
jgi:hypothetical protein